MNEIVAEAGRATRVMRWLKKEILPLAVMLALMVVARASFANHYHVPSGSMEYTLMPGDRVVVDMSAYGVRIPFTETVVWSRGVPQAGDVALFDSPEDGTRLIKRVIAVAGDRVELVEGRLMLNGLPLQALDAADVETFGQHYALLNLDAGGGPDIYGMTIPAGMVLAVGDHRGDSYDSRYFGLVPARALYGKAIAVYHRSGEGFVWRKL